MKLRSIRLRLPLTYAGIALLAALALGVVLLTILRGYYAELERQHLQTNAEGIAATMAQLLGSGLEDFVIKDQVNSWAFFLEARVQVQDPTGRVVADSGYPDARRLLTVSYPPSGKVLIQSYTRLDKSGAASSSVTETVGLPPWQVYILPEEGLVSGTVGVPAVDAMYAAPGPEMQKAPGKADIVIFNVQNANPQDLAFTRPVTKVFTTTARMDPGSGAVGVAIPLSRSLYGFSLLGQTEAQAARASKVVKLEPTLRSSQVIRQEVMGPQGERLGAILLSGGPAYGNEILSSVARGWLVASLAAVLLAGLVGWRVSYSLTGPLLALTAVTGQMAAGDLSVRSGLSSDDELGDLSRAFNDMAGRVESTIQALRNFIGDAAHQLHTPLTALDTYLELARDETDLERKHGYLAAAEVQTSRLEAVINGLLELSRLEDRPAARTTFDLRAVTAELAEVFASRAEQADLHFRFDAPDQPVFLAGDARQLREAIFNLLDNAFKFTSTGGEVVLHLEVDQAQAVIMVSDTGIGFEPQELPRLFGRFYRGRNAAAYPGSGLGLAIVRSIVDAHGGQVLAERLAPGARFSLYLPRQVQPKTADRAAAEDQKGVIIPPMSDQLSHIDDTGRAHMVDVGAKSPTRRTAIARGEVLMRPETLALIQAGAMKKGDVLTVAQIAGVMAAKRTSELIPLCHPLPLDHIDVQFELDPGLPGVRIQASASTTGKTGVEMEALTAVSVAALTIYDMAKAVEKTMRIHNVRLVEKHGGLSGDVQNE